MTPRAIKFRAWDKYWRTMKMDPAHEPGDAQVTILNDDFFKDEYFVLMQFTGLRDKNGREIYEGDIVKTHDGCVMVVEWRSDKSWWVITPVIPTMAHPSSVHLWYASSPEHFAAEIIGNIYEHPQLLEAHP